MITQKNILIILLISIFFVSCGKIDNQSYADADAMVENAKANIKTIEVTNLQIILDSTEHINVVVVDCREPKEYAEKHIPGAINVPRGMLEFSPKISNRHNTYYIYSNTDKRASLCCNTLPLLKYKNIPTNKHK